ncbi:glycosyltransferase [Actinokineospora auranticolor]|uniref:Glycosyltransferase involved in cell wall biosynthesis n=1 Tax=Actinokineospora auranticolor TaxID=155976 RepID=A0A2S6GQ38_9PSEU|nr:glycosyltransferase [Actinokineospora auranticolor]PPK67344.1 glycosyltransferase involved in cell wall biosynthesis [Actinokineospora auranticolor]
MSGKKVIALVTDAIHPYSRGGKEIRYHELAKRLAARGDVHVFTMHWWDGPPTIRRDGVTYHALCRTIPMYKGARRSIRQALVFAFACLGLLRHRFDVIEADHMPYLPVFACKVVAALRRTRLVVTWHEVWGDDYWRAYLGRLGTVAWCVERLAMRLPDTILAASAHTADRLRAVLGAGADVVVAPNGIDLDLVRAASPAATRADIVVVGRLMEHKRVDLLLDAVARLRDRGRAVTCLVIGDGPERENLAAKARELGLGSAVRFRHDVAGQEQLYGLMKGAKVFAAPSAREGFGVAVLEALACGMPVVTTDAPDNLARHLVRRSARGRVCAATPGAFADAIAAALAEPRTGVVEDWVEQFGWDATADVAAKAVLA